MLLHFKKSLSFASHILTKNNILDLHSCGQFSECQRDYGSKYLVLTVIVFPVE
jgi:hypothetical protein